MLAAPGRSKSLQQNVENGAVETVRVRSVAFFSAGLPPGTPNFGKTLDSRIQSYFWHDKFHWNMFLSTGIEKEVFLITISLFFSFLLPSEFEFSQHFTLRSKTVTTSQLNAINRST